MQKETYSRPNNRTECSPCLRRRLHLVHLFFQGHFEIVLHKCNRLRQADFKSVTTGRKNTTNNKRTLCHYAKGNLFETQQQNWMLTLPPSSTASCPSLFPRPFRYHPAQVKTFATGRLQVSNNWKKKHNKQQKNTVPLCKRKPIQDPTTELNAHPASVVDCILSISFSKAFSISSCTSANVCNRQISNQ